jgi:hypothetical protein
MQAFFPAKRENLRKNSDFVIAYNVYYNNNNIANIKIQLPK